jgi:hypothetical protein
VSMAAGRQRRGAPIAVLALLLASWVGVRAALWEEPFEAAVPKRIAPPLARAKKSIETPQTTRIYEPGLDRDRQSHNLTAGLAERNRPTIARSTTALAFKARAPTRTARPLATSYPPSAAVQIPALPGLRSVEAQLSPGPTANLGRNAGFDPRPVEVPPKARPWRIDGWFAWRPGGGLPRLARGVPLTPAYGATQGGLAARLDLGASQQRPALNLRLTHSPDRVAQSELALGLSARPFARVPVRLQGELRATRTAGDAVLRPAAFALSELGPQPLALGFSLESYAQAGWVGGRYGTAFADGQVRVDRDAVRFGNVKVRAGAGAWGGAQKFASRLDVGPGITLDLRDAGVSARLSLDYRFRIAGTARPGSGPAVTLSTGF